MGTEQICPDCFQGRIKNGRCLQCGFDIRTRKMNSMGLSPFIRLKERYLLGRILGNGGFGITYKAYDEREAGYCAVKEFVPQGLVSRFGGERCLHVTSVDNEGDFGHGKKRFMEEARILKELDGLPEVVQIRDYFEENGTVYFVMEYLEGVNLLQFMQHYGGRLPVKEALSVLCTAGDCLEQVHSRAHIFHRDISPDNIMITKEGRVKVIDFGNAKYFMGKKNQTFTPVLKHGYAPPEQYSSTGEQGSFTDVYALAATLYYVLSGVKLPSSPERWGGEGYISLSGLRPEVPLYVSEAVDRALILDSRKRTRTMRAFMEELRAVPMTISHTGAGQSVKGLERAEKKSARTPYVKLIGCKKEMKWELPENRSVILGRSYTQADIVPGEDGRVSSRHCELYYDSILECFCIVDNSLNGTFARGKRLEKGKIYDLQAGETFSIGNNIYVMKVGTEE